MKNLIALFVILFVLSGSFVPANRDEKPLRDEPKEDIVEVQEEPVQEIVEEEPLHVRLEQMASRGEIRSLNMTITAYDLSYESCGKYEDDPAYGITASGTYAREGIVAVDPRIIPLHSRLYIEGYGIYLAEDTGGAIKGERLDLFILDHAEAVKFGEQKRKVYILQE